MVLKMEMNSFQKIISIACGAMDLQKRKYAFIALMLNYLKLLLT